MTGMTVGGVPRAKGRRGSGLRSKQAKKLKRERIGIESQRAMSRVKNRQRAMAEARRVRGAG